MKFGTGIGIVISCIGIAMGATMEGTNVAVVINIPAILIVLVGTLGATIAACGLEAHIRLPLIYKKALMPNRPFFAYYAPGATHAPHHVPAEWADKYKGRFDDGWDALRERTFAKQKELGVVPPDCDLTDRSTGIPAWDEVDDEMKPVLARQMEIYAGYLENTDHHVGLLLDALEDLKVLDDTLVYVIIGDNGASAEGSLQGTFNEMITLGGFGALETAEFMSSKIDKFGGPEAYNHYAVGWAHAQLGRGPRAVR